MKTRSKLVPCLLACAAVAALSFAFVRDSAGQQQTPVAQPPRPAASRSVVLLDAAHGGSDPGADLGDKLAEKTITLALATKLRGALAAQGFNVVLTRDADGGAPLTADQRAETANRSHALACVSLHATRSGSGVHVYTSALQPGDASADAGYVPKRWNSLQEDFVAQSTSLAAGLKTALTAAGLATDVRTATVPPLDSLMCPAVAVEFAPMQGLSAAEKGIADAGYQDSGVRALAAALVKWRTDSGPPPNAPVPQGQPPAKDAP